MKVTSSVFFKYTSKKYAKVSYESLEVDNDEGYIGSRLDGDVVKYELNSASLGSFLNTFDDLIASEILVLEILKNTE